MQIVLGLPVTRTGVANQARSGAGLAFEFSRPSQFSAVKMTVSGIRAGVPIVIPDHAG